LTNIGRTRTTGRDTDLPNPIAGGKKPALKEGINKEKLAEFRGLLAHLGSVKVSDKVVESPENASVVAKLLYDKNKHVRECATEALVRAAWKGADITAAIPALVRALGDKIATVRSNAAWALWNAALKGADLTPAIPGLVRTLGDPDKNVRKRAAEALDKALNAGADITAAIPGLLDMLGDRNASVREAAARALSGAAADEKTQDAALNELVRALGNEDRTVFEGAAMALRFATDHTKAQRTRTLAVNKIIGFLQSESFQAEMERNSVAYERIAIEIAGLLGKIKEAEKKVA
jgi:HEAT repeat protein